jgi:hypothetical protein
MNAEKLKYTLINTCNHSTIEDGGCISYPSTVAMFKAPKHVFYVMREYTNTCIYVTLFFETRQEVKSSHVNGSTNLLNSPSSVLVTYCGK